MYLKTLEIQGFKSFADKTKIDFGQGITAIVGPNGSGKSNISDAIRWVLGEQNARSLRGSKMEDVIFAGSSHRKPLGMAEVSLCLDNKAGILPISYAEVTVTRRIFRSGESDYLINRHPCRLKDVHNLFNDVGLGKDSFAIISQGHVEEVLNSKPEERRNLMEQAAGLMKYRNRKREALKKLEDTQQSLVRLEDILAELEMNLKPIQAECQKAKIYQSLKRELDALEINLVVQELEKIIADYEKIKKELETKKVYFLAKEKKHQELEEIFNQEKIKLQKVNQDLADNQQNLYQLSESLNQTVNSLEVSQERLNFVTQQLQKISKEREHHNYKLAQLKKTYEQQIQDYEKISALIRGKKKNIESKNIAIAHLEETINSGEERLEELKNEIINCLQEVSQVKNTLNQANYRYNYQQRALSKNRQHVLELTEKLQEINKELQSLESQYEKNRKILRQLLEEKRALDSQLRKLEETVQNNQNLLHVKQKELDHQLSRYQVLKDMQQNHEGYMQGVKAVLRAKASGHPQCQGICGVIGDLLGVAAEYEKAIEVALGGSLQFLVTQNTKAAQTAISFLKENKLGRATFLPLNSIQPRALSQAGQNLLGTEGVIGIAADLVEFDPVYTTVVRHLLGNILVIKDLDTALALAKKVDYNVKMVTLEGDVLNPGGSLTGGSLRKKQFSFFSRLREIKNLETQILTQQKQIKGLEKVTVDLKSELVGLRQQYDRYLEQIQSLQLLLATGEENIKKKKQDMATLSQEIELLKFEGENLEKDLSQIKNEQHQQEKNLEELETKHKKLEKTAKELQATLRFEKESKKFLEEELTTYKIELATMMQQESALQEDLKIFYESEQEYTQLLKGYKEEQQKLQGQQEELIKLINTYKEKKFLLLEKKGELESKGQYLLTYQKELERTTQELEHQVNIQIQEMNQKQKELYKLELQQAKLESEKNNYLKRLEENFSLSYEEALKRSSPIESFTQVQSRITYLKEKITSLGNVNLAAIDEYKRLKERFDFLEQQRRDMDQAKRTLDKVIEEIDQTMTTRFKNVFEQVNEAFKKIFSQLFGGGQAYLELTEPDNLLETGLEIIAQPPGKKLQNLSLLSGGERALTVISLLFAILEVKPVPFCVLDEIEAALDEANVDRFAQFLRAYADKTQFIIISHRQGTIEAADALYGVTMEESGVSKLVSVRLTSESTEIESA